MSKSIKHADGSSESGLEREERLDFSGPFQVDVSSIDVTHVKERMLAVALGALSIVTKAHVSAAIKSASKHVANMVENHPTPNGADVKRTVAMWSSRQSVATMLATFQRFGFSKPSAAVNQVWRFADITGAQRSGNVYMALKAQDKFLALCGWFLTGDALTAWNKNKYMATIVTTCEVLNVDKIDNETIYSVYQSHKSRLDSLTSDVSADLRAKLMDAQLYKSAATASTQRTTSANLLQALGAGTNAGNERVIYVDRESDVYLALRASLFGAAGF